MVNKFKYSAASNEVVQIAPMEEPEFSRNSFNPEKDFRLYRQNLANWVIYDQHLASLARYPCQGFGPEDDGKEFEEVEGFALQICSCGIGHQCKVNPENYNKPCRIAVRIPDKGEVGIKILLTDNYFPVECDKCGWFGSSGSLDGGHQIADTGDHADTFCPVCGAHCEDETNETVSLSTMPRRLYKAHEIIKHFRKLYDDAYWSNMSAQIEKEQPAPAYPAELEPDPDFTLWVVVNKWRHDHVSQRWYTHFVREMEEKIFTHSELYQEYLQSKK